jgi:hypothetical protein
LPGVDTTHTHPAGVPVWVKTWPDLAPVHLDPVSLTETAKRPFRAPAAMLTSPASVNLIAFPTRFSNACVSRCSSLTPIGRDLSTDVVRVSFLF